VGNFLKLTNEEIKEKKLKKKKKKKAIARARCDVNLASKRIEVD
jgi:hypothetical protein